MKNLFNCEPILYWKNKEKIYLNRRNSYKVGTDKYLKYDSLYKRAIYQIANWEIVNRI